MSETQAAKKMLLTCPGCQKRFQVTGSNLLGKRATCKTCAASFIVDGGCICEVADDVELPVKTPASVSLSDLTTASADNVPSIPASTRRPPIVAEFRGLIATANPRVLVPILLPFSLTAVSMVLGALIIQNVCIYRPAYGVYFVATLGMGLALSVVLPFAFWKNTRTRRHISRSALFSAVIVALSIWLGTYEVRHEDQDGTADVVLHSRWDGRPLYRSVSDLDEHAGQDLGANDLGPENKEIFAALAKGEMAANDRDRAAAFWPIVRNTSKLEDVNDFYDNPTFITTKLADDPYSWSHVIGVRDSVTRDQEPTLCIEVQSHLQSLVWFPLKTNIAFKLESYGETGENELVEWKTTHAINDGLQQYAIAFRLKR